MSRVNLDTLRPWITTKVTEMLGVEDDVLIEFICNQLDEEEVMCGIQRPVVVLGSDRLNSVISSSLISL